MLIDTVAGTKSNGPEPFNGHCKDAFAMMLHSVQSRTCHAPFRSSTRSICVGVKKLPISRLNASLVESISFDTVGRLTWDASALPGADNAEILEGYTIRPNQVRTAVLGSHNARAFFVAVAGTCAPSEHYQQQHCHISPLHTHLLFSCTGARRTTRICTEEMQQQ